MDPVILETMNDIIDKIDRREWLRVNEHRDRLVKKMTKQSQKNEKEIKELKEKLQLFERLRDQDTYSIKRLEKLNREVKCSRCAPWRGN
jgi:predicted RNase H-like nuclease (RuvC/YqgF family)